jgi:hypothetical protein
MRRESKPRALQYNDPRPDDSSSVEAASLDRLRRVPSLENVNVNAIQDPADKKLSLPSRKVLCDDLRANAQAQVVKSFGLNHDLGQHGFVILFTVRSVLVGFALSALASKPRPG